MNHENFGRSCTNCIGTGVIRGPGEYRGICPVCDGLGRLVIGYPTQKCVSSPSAKEERAPA